MFDVGLTVHWGGEDPQSKQIQNAVPARRWLTYNHHEGHAAAGFFASPFRTALVISMDGMGNDGNQVTFLADRSRGLEVLNRQWSGMGHWYLHIGRALSELSKPRAQCYRLDDKISKDLRPCLHVAGKKMGYAALGRVREVRGRSNFAA